LSVGGMPLADMERMLFQEHQMLEAHLSSNPRIDFDELMCHYASVYRPLGLRHGITMRVQLFLCDVLVGNPELGSDLLESLIDGLVATVRRNGEQPGEMLPVLTQVAHVLVRKKRFDKAKALYDLALEFLTIYGEGSPKVKDAQRGLQACAKKDPKLVRGL